MTPNDFRRIALAMPEAVEAAHMNHPDFRVKGKIFATLMPGGESGMLKLTPDQQREFVKEKPTMFSPVKGGWGRRGATQVHLAAATKTALRDALTAAWLNTAPQRLIEESGLSAAE